MHAIENTATKRKLKWWYPANGLRATDDSSKKWVKPYYNRRPTLSFRISPASYFDNRLLIHLDLLWLALYVRLPIYSNIDDCEYPEFGFYYHENALVLCIGMRHKFIYMPWYYEWVRTSKLRADGTWWTDRKGDTKKWKKKNAGDNLYTRMGQAEKLAQGTLWQESHPYLYTTKDGTVQDDIVATIGVEEREWRPKWFQWTKLFRQVVKSISIEFSNEVGNQRGSFKGGTVGCSWNMLPNETPHETLMRMQKTRSFDR